MARDLATFRTAVADPAAASEASVSRAARRTLRRSAALLRREQSTSARVNAPADAAEYFTAASDRPRSRSRSRPDGAAAYDLAAAAGRGADRAIRRVASAAAWADLHGGRPRIAEFVRWIVERNVNEASNASSPSSGPANRGARRALARARIAQRNVYRRRLSRVLGVGRRRDRRPTSTATVTSMHRGLRRCERRALQPARRRRRCAAGAPARARHGRRASVTRSACSCSNASHKFSHRGLDGSFLRRPARRRSKRR